MANVAYGHEAEPRRFAWTKLAWLVVGLVLVWSWYTTFSGMQRILGSPVGPSIMATATQTMLAIVSYLLGKDLAAYLSGPRGYGGRRTSIGAALGRYTLLLALFCLSLAGSAFFSFNFYFNQLFAYRQSSIVYAELPQQLNTTVMPDLATRVKGAYAADAARLATDPISTKWLDSLDGIANQAKAARAQIAAVVQKQEEDRRRAEDLAKQKLAELQKKADQIAIQKRRDEDEVKKRTTRIAQIEAQIPGKEADKKTAAENIVKAQADADAELVEVRTDERGVSLNKFDRVVGKGNFYNIALARVEAAKRLGEAAEKAIRDLEQERAKLNGEIRDFNTKIEGYDRVINEAKDTEKALSRSPQSTTGPTEAAASVDTLVGELTERRKGFVSDPTTDSYTRLVDSCERLLRPLRETPAVASQFGDATCRSDDLARLVQARPEIIAAQKNFDDQCALDKVAVMMREAAGLASGGKGNEGLEKAQRTIEGCIDLASAARVRVDDIQKRVSDFIEINSPQRDEFAKTLGAFKLGPTQAYIAAFASGIQDLVIFFFSLLSEMLRHDRHAPLRQASFGPVDIAPRAGDPGAVASAKAMLRMIAYTKGRGDRLDPSGQVWNAMAPELRDNILVQLQSLGRQGRAHLDRRGTWTIEPGAVIELEHIIHQHASLNPAQSPAPQRDDVRNVELKGAAQEKYTGEFSANQSGSLARPASTEEGPANVVSMQSAPRPSRVQELLERESGQNTFPTARNRGTRDADER